MRGTTMGDILSATSLLLTMITVLYGVWYSEINNTINLKEPLHSEDGKLIYKMVVSVLNHKAIPLFIASLSLTLIMLAQVVCIIEEACTIVLINKWTSFKYYDVVKMIYCTVFVFSFSLSVYTYNSVRQLHKKKIKLT